MPQAPWGDLRSDVVSPAPPRDPRTDEALIQAINQGDPLAFEVLYYRYRDWVVRLAYRFTAHHDDSLDVLQETFAYLLGKSPALQLSARMTTFLYPVVKHLSLAAKHKRRRLCSADPLPDPPASTDPVPEEQSRADLARVIQSLGEDQREVVLMRFVDDLSLAEIAEALNMPIGTVKSKLHRALERLHDDPRTRQYFDA
jgi:RNA polymerase sigma-70 factor, ECF subfamily